MNALPLDPQNTRVVKNRLRELAHSGVTIFMSTHTLSLAEEIADRIGIMYAGRLVELGTSSEILSSPVHPYTKGLVASFPTIHGPKVRLEGIPGNPPSLLDLPTGCAFAERCSQRTEICGKAVPDLVPYGSRIAACHALGPKESAA